MTISFLKAIQMTETVKRKVVSVFHENINKIGEMRSLTILKKYV